MNARNKYKNKLFSILGDSISTLDGYSIPDDAAFYVGYQKMKTGVLTPEDTWWGRVIEHFDGKLFVNNSISGSMVCKHRDALIPSYGCSDERASALSWDNRSPDVIMIFMGVNDWGHGVKLKPECPEEAEDLSIFSVAYRSMLEKLRRNYPTAEILCLTLPVSEFKSREEFAFPYRYGGVHIEEYCNIIRACANECGCRVIDLYRFSAPYDTIDGFHPNAEGMKTLADAVICQLEEAK